LLRDVQNERKSAIGGQKGGEGKGRLMKGLGSPKKKCEPKRKRGEESANPTGLGGTDIPHRRAASRERGIKKKEV